MECYFNVDFNFSVDIRNKTACKYADTYDNNTINNSNNDNIHTSDINSNTTSTGNNNNTINAIDMIIVMIITIIVIVILTFERLAEYGWKPRRDRLRLDT